MSYETGTHRVQENVPNRSEQVGVLHRERREALLPEVPGPPVPPVDFYCVSAVGFPDGAGKACLNCRNDDQMDVVRQEAIRPDLQLALARHPTQELSVAAVVLIREEHAHPTCPSLDYVMGHSGYDDAWETGHSSGKTGSASRFLRDEYPVTASLCRRGLIG
jgi:hypothetical protein